jgi:hypothetical protein
VSNLLLGCAAAVLFVEGERKRGAGRTFGPRRIGGIGNIFGVNCGGENSEDSHGEQSVAVHCGSFPSRPTWKSCRHGKWLSGNGVDGNGIREINVGIKIAA